MPGNTTVAVTYTNSHGLHLFRLGHNHAPRPARIIRRWEQRAVFRWVAVAVELMDPRRCDR